MRRKVPRLVLKISTEEDSTTSVCSTFQCCHPQSKVLPRVLMELSYVPVCAHVCPDVLWPHLTWLSLLHTLSLFIICLATATSFAAITGLHHFSSLLSNNFLLVSSKVVWVVKWTERILFFSVLHYFKRYYPFPPSFTLSVDPYSLLLSQWCKSQFTDYFSCIFCFLLSNLSCLETACLKRLWRALLYFVISLCHQDVYQNDNS